MDITVATAITPGGDAVATVVMAATDITAANQQQQMKQQDVRKLRAWHIKPNQIHCNSEKLSVQAITLEMYKNHIFLIKHTEYQDSII